MAKKRPKRAGNPEDSNQIKKPSGFCYWENEVLVLNILGTPAAKSDKIGKPKGNQLKVSVKATPKAGRATDYMVDFLSNAFGVRASDIEVVFGRTNVNKQLRIKAPTKLPSIIDKFLKKKSSLSSAAGP
ncbi:MAG: DUF167 domain-containing protein [Desulfoarculaceae bacterium]|nr:DUF167 domain-containing protein [Desulfoarculaceae bacterium]